MSKLKCQNCYKLAFEIGKLEAEIERLNVEIAKLKEAIEFCELNLLARVK